MGFDILKKGLDKVRENTPASTKIGWTSTGNITCLDEYLKLLSGNLTVLAQFKNLLLGLIVITEETVASLQVIIAQYETAKEITLRFIEIFKSVKRAADSTLQPFAFDDPRFIACIPVQAIKSYMTTTLPKPNISSTLPGNAQRYVKKYKQTTKSVKELEFKVLRIDKSIEKRKRKIEEARVNILAWQAIVDAIGAQFGV